MTDRSDAMAELDSFFRAARTSAPVPSADLTARILADAAAAQPRARTQEATARRAWGKRWRGLRRLYLPALGGPGVIAGLAGAIVAGAWIGFLQPAPLASLASRVTGQTAMLEQIDLIPTLDSYLTTDTGE
ncbi:hypothetical protein U879_18340 [Defluviimonas sp. 20V17]|nr:hypothetical protein U879_18340 [Defluviimonas sp. 20V17]